MLVSLAVDMYHRPNKEIGTCSIHTKYTVITAVCVPVFRLLQY